jgi:hypothetical protein
MPRFYEPDLGTHPDSPFARDASNKLVRRSYWLDMNDRTLGSLIESFIELMSQVFMLPIFHRRTSC